MNEREYLLWQYDRGLISYDKLQEELEKLNRNDE